MTESGSTRRFTVRVDGKDWDEARSLSVTVANPVATRNSWFGFEQDLSGTFRSAQNIVLTDNAVGPTSGTISTGGVLY